MEALVEPADDGTEIRRYLTELARHEAEARPAIFEDELPIAVELRLVHRDPDGAERERRVADDGPLEAIVADDGDAVATLDAEGDEARAQPGDLAAEVAIAGPAPGRPKVAEW